MSFFLLLCCVVSCSSSFWCMVRCPLRPLSLSVSLSQAQEGGEEEEKEKKTCWNVRVCMCPLLLQRAHLSSPCLLRAAGMERTGSPLRRSSGPASSSMPPSASRGASYTSRPPPPASASQRFTPSRSRMQHQEVCSSSSFPPPHTKHTQGGGQGGGQTHTHTHTLTETAHTHTRTWTCMLLLLLLLLCVGASGLHSAACGSRRGGVGVREGQALLSPMQACLCLGRLCACKHVGEKAAL